MLALEDNRHVVTRFGFHRFTDIHRPAFEPILRRKEYIEVEHVDLLDMVGKLRREKLTLGKYLGSALHLKTRGIVRNRRQHRLNILVVCFLEVGDCLPYVTRRRFGVFGSGKTRQDSEYKNRQNES